MFIPAIEGYVPEDMVCALTAYLDFCYLARRATHTTTDLDELDEALDRFHQYRHIFQETGVHEEGPEGLSLPCQHALMHYRELIKQFGSPNGLCTSITEAKHIKAVKEPWRRSSCFEALGQILLTNQCLDKLSASRADFMKRGMLKNDCLYEIWSEHFADETDAQEIHSPTPQEALNNDFKVDENQLVFEDDVEMAAVDGDIPNDVYLAGKPRK